MRAHIREHILPYVELLQHRLRAARRAAGVTQVELSKALGVSQSLVSLWESGNAESRAGLTPRMADTLGVSVVWLLTGKEAA